MTCGPDDDRYVGPWPTPTKTAPDPRAWRVAIALAHECGLDWAKVAHTHLGMPPFVAADAKCDCIRIHDRACPVYRAAGIATWLRLTPAQMVEAYLADCARRQVEPGPLPSLSWRSADNRVWWGVRCDGGGITTAEVRVGTCNLAIFADGIPTTRVQLGAMAWDDLAEATRIGTAAAEAMVP